MIDRICSRPDGRRGGMKLFSPHGSCAWEMQQAFGSRGDRLSGPPDLCGGALREVYRVRPDQHASFRTPGSHLENAGGGDRPRLSCRETFFSSEQKAAGAGRWCAHRRRPNGRGRDRLLAVRSPLRPVLFGYLFHMSHLSRSTLVIVPA